MKFILKTLLFTLFLNCSNSTTQIPFEYNLENKKHNSYSMVLTIAETKVTQEIEFISESARNDSLFFDAYVRKIKWDDPSLSEEDNKTNNDFYQRRIIDTPLEFKLSTKGKILEPLTEKLSGNDATDFFDVNMFFIPFSTNGTTINNKWEIERDIRDIVFKTLKTTYKIEDISDNTAHISFESKYLPKETMFSKQNNGFYSIDITTGLVLEAEIKISGFNGMKNSSSLLKIKKKK